MTQYTFVNKAVWTYDRVYPRVQGAPHPSPIELYGCTVSLTHSDLSQAPCRRPLETRPLVTVHLRPWRSTSASRPHERAAHSERLEALEAACVEG